MGQDSSNEDMSFAVHLNPTDCIYSSEVTIINNAGNEAVQVALHHIVLVYFILTTTLMVHPFM
jgi:hypothetical protein